MLVRLKDLKPNPIRDFTIDPIDDEASVNIEASINDHGFWGGVVCRRAADGSIEIVGGHHRVKAAIAYGIKEADLYVGEMDDDEMVIIYARENATQRGTEGTAMAGAVAAAIKQIAKSIARGERSCHGSMTRSEGSIRRPNGQRRRHWTKKHSPIL